MNLASARLALAVFVPGLLALTAVTHAYADGRPVCRTYPTVATNKPAPIIPCRSLEEVRDLSDRTHVSVMPTGNTLSAGQIALRSHELGLHNNLAFGLTEHVEVSVSVPVIPLVMSGNVRIGFLPRTQPYRLVLSVGAWRQIFDISDDDFVFGTGAITAAYQGRTFNLHATAGLAKPFFHDYDGDQDILAGVSAGAVIKTSPVSKFAFFAEVGRLRVLRDRNIASGVMAGVKIIGVHFDTDVGFLLPMGLDESDDFGPLPLLSINYRH